ncbi:hypothetical protein [Clostridium butyricum]
MIKRLKKTSALIVLATTLATIFLLEICRLELKQPISIVTNFQIITILNH